MEEKHREILRKCHVALVRDLEPKKIFAHLIQEGVMTPDDQEGINKIDTQTSQTEEFLRILPKRGPGAYQEFVRALEEKQAFLACVLLREELEAVKAECRELKNQLKKNQGEFVAVEAGSRQQKNQFQGNQEALNKSSNKQPGGKKKRYTKRTKNNTRGKLGTLPMKVATAGVTTKKTAQEQNALQERMRDYATIGLKYFPLTTQQDLQRFSCYLTDYLDLALKDKKTGSLILTVHCRTLEILERLWEDYCSGHLDEIAEECFLTDETKKTKEERGEKSEADADTICLETTILKEDYLRCKKFLTEISDFKSLTDEETIVMENIKYKNILLKFHALLLEKLDPTEVSLQLLTAGVLTSDDKEKIEEKPSQKEKSEELLMILATKGPRAYEEFVKALEKDQCFLACQLLKQEKENLLYEVREREWVLNETINELLLEEERAITAASENEELKAQLEEAKNSVPRKKAVTLVEIVGIVQDLESCWEQLGTALELDEANLRKIKKENKTDCEKAYAVLKMWADKEGQDATMGRLADTLKKIGKRGTADKLLEQEEIVDGQREVSRLLEKTKDEISVENRRKEASEENSVEAVLTELAIQLPEEEDDDEQREVAKLLKEVNDGISVENRKKHGSKENSLEAMFKKPNIQPQEASSHEGKKPKKRGSKKGAMAS